MTSLRLADVAENDNQDGLGKQKFSYLVDDIVIGWYMCPISAARLLKDRLWATAAAFIPCPFNEYGPTERPRVPMVEIDGVIQEHTLEAFHRIARWPIDRNEWMRRRGLHV